MTLEEEMKLRERWAKESGLEQGREEGIEQGIAQGREQGGIQACREIAQKLKQHEVDIDTICYYTGLTPDEIKNL